MVSFKVIASVSPMTLAIAILAISIMTTTLIFKTSVTSWLCFVIILTFSSGMMTLFMYTASMTSNEKMKSKKGPKVALMLLAILITHSNPEDMAKKDSMLTFSNKIMIMMIAAVLIFTMLVISSQGHHPNQTVSSSF